MILAVSSSPTTCTTTYCVELNLFKNNGAALCGRPLGCAAAASRGSVRAVSVGEFIWFRGIPAPFRDGSEKALQLPDEGPDQTPSITTTANRN